MNKEILINILDLWKTQILQIEEDVKEELYMKARAKNGWFVKRYIDLSFNGLTNYLDTQKLEKWLSEIDMEEHSKDIKNVGIVMAGNIPMVGFHDLLSVIVSGHNALVKFSSQDEVLLSHLINILFELDPHFKDRITMVDRLQNAEAVIATGSNNSARYFNYYFQNVPNIIRKNRTSFGILDGKESAEELEGLGHDILDYFGLGCRNVSKLLVPKGYDFRSFFEAIQPLEYVSDTHKYVNNYDYNKSIYLINQDHFLDNGFLLLRQSDQLVSPVSVLYFDTYNEGDEVDQYIAMNTEKIQCIASRDGIIEGAIPFGSTQKPELWDFADNVNTLEFLKEIRN
jgi:hypothetical protein